MKVINLVPGSPEWLKSRSASKAPVIMGDSNYQTRNELLHQMSTGITKEIDAQTQARFDNGHDTEALSRVIVEEMMGEELSPVSAADDDGYLTANFDGVTFPYKKGYEHKAWNEKLAATVRGGTVPDGHAWQLDQQIMVGKLDYVLFVVSDGTKEKFASIEYKSSKERQERLMAAWQQFDIDLANYQHVEEKAAPVAEVIMGLPAVSVQATGMVTASNLPEFKKAADTFIANIKTELISDQDFVDAEANVKFCKTAEDDLEGAKKSMLAQTSSINEVIQTIDFIKGQLASKRLMLDKLVKWEKEIRKLAIVSAAGIAFSAHVESLESETRPIQLNVTRPDFAGAMKGLKKLSAMQEAVDTVLRNAVFEADKVAKDIRAKLAWCKEHASGHSALFPDLQHIINREMDVFTLTITSRIDKHKADEAARLEADRAKIQAEEEAKATAKAKAVSDAAIDAMVAKKRAEIEAVAPTSKPSLQVPKNISKPSRPTDKELIMCIADGWNVSHGQACDWILETAESLKVTA